MTSKDVRVSIYYNNRGTFVSIIGNGFDSAIVQTNATTLGQLPAAALWADGAPRETVGWANHPYRAILGRHSCVL